MPRHDGASEYRRVAHHRLNDAQELLEQPSRSVKLGDPASRHLRGAMYLAGYAVECILKAYIIAQSACRTLSDVDPNLTKAAGHNLDQLLVRSGLGDSLGDHVSDWRLCRTWTPDWRYDSAIPKRGEAVN